jgi:tripartite-type tricarboxylate transporter receptor subunit TctC
LFLLLFFTMATRSISGIAQDYPTRPIRFVVPFPSSGGGDIIIRALSQKLSERLGQAIVVDNRSGAGGNVGTEIVARSPADGYTLVMANISPFSINVSIYKKLPYNPLTDFTPITLVASFPNVLVVHPSLPAASIKDLIALARSRPGQLTYASSGAGSTTHLSAEFFKSQAKLDLVHVPYKGGGQALIDLIAGHVSMYFSSVPGAIPHMRSRRLRGLAVTSIARSSASPDTPTLAESGFPGFEAATWIGAAAPAGLARPIVNRLNAEIVEIMRAPDMRERLISQGAESQTNSPEQFAAYIKSEIAKWAKIVRDTGVATQ